MATMRFVCPEHHILFHLICGEYNTLWSSSLCKLLQLPPNSCLLGPHILLSTLSSNTLNLCSFLRMRDQVSHPHCHHSRSIFGRNVLNNVICLLLLLLLLLFKLLLLRVPGALFLGIKLPAREADHLPPSSAEVKNEWSYTSTLPIRLHGVVLS
jgi:hypothetical protein